MTFKLRYYAPIDKSIPFRHRERYDEVLQILESIKTKHDIDCEVFRIRFEEVSCSLYVDEKHEKEIYETQFKPRTRILNKRIGTRLPKCLRSRGGRRHYYVAGVVTLLKNELVEWFTCFESCKDKFKNYDGDLDIGFLKAVLDVGSPLIEDLCRIPELAERRSEMDLIDKFIKSDILKGKFNLEVKVGSRVYESFDYRKSIDVLCSSQGEIWIIEAKTSLNYEALGEVITYAHLYLREHPADKIRIGIICSELDVEILETCTSYGITVFGLGEKGFEIYQ